MIDRWERAVLSKYPTMDVYAVIKPTGEAERVNVITHRTFYAIDSFVDKHLGGHDKVRWLVASENADDTIGVIDLWRTTMVSRLPYKEPYWIKETFDNVDQAIGFVALNLVI